MGGHSLLQGISLTKGLNLGLLHGRQILYHLSHQGSLYCLAKLGVRRGRLEHLRGSLSAATSLLYVPIWHSEVGGPGPPLGRNLLRLVVIAPSGRGPDSEVSRGCSSLSFCLACKKRDRFLISPKSFVSQVYTPLPPQQTNYRPLLPLSGPLLLLLLLSRFSRVQLCATP